MLLLIIALPSVVVLWYSWPLFQINVLDAPLPAMLPLAASLASLATLFGCVAGILRPRVYHRKVLLPAMAVLAMSMLVALWAEGWIVRGLPPSDEFVRFHRLRVDVEASCLAVYLAGICALLPTRPWLAFVSAGDKSQSP